MPGRRQTPPCCAYSVTYGACANGSWGTGVTIEGSYAWRGRHRTHLGTDFALDLVDGLVVAKAGHRHSQRHTGAVLRPTLHGPGVEVGLALAAHLHHGRVLVRVEISRRVPVAAGDGRVHLAERADFAWVGHNGTCEERGEKGANVAP